MMRRSFPPRAARTGTWRRVWRGVILSLAVASLAVQAQTTPSTVMPLSSNIEEAATPNHPAAESPIWQLLMANPSVGSASKKEGELEPSKSPPSNGSSLILRLNDVLALPEVHQKLLRIGTPLNFTLTFSLNQSRWYAWSKEWLQVVLPIRIGYDTLAERYWVSRLQQTLTYPSYEALSASALKFDWGVLPILSLPKGEYQASLTLEFDRKTLPLTLQMDVRPNTKWLWDKRYPEQELNIRMP